MLQHPRVLHPTPKSSPLRPGCRTICRRGAQPSGVWARVCVSHHGYTTVASYIHPTGICMHILCAKVSNPKNKSIIYPMMRGPVRLNCLSWGFDWGILYLIVESQDFLRYFTSITITHSFRFEGWLSFYLSCPLSVWNPFQEMLARLKKEKFDLLYPWTPVSDACSSW